MEMTRYSVEPRIRKYVKGYGFLSFARKYKEQLLDTGLDAVETTSKKVAHKSGECIRNRIGDEETKSNYNKIVKQEPLEEIIFLPEKREILDKLRKLLQKWNTIKCLIY